MTEPRERSLAALAHVASFAGWAVPFGNVLGPLLVWLFARDESSFVDLHGREALNFQITMLIAIFAAAVLTVCLIGFVLIPVIAVVDVVFTVIAAIAAYNGDAYHYPLTLRIL